MSKSIVLILLLLAVLCNGPSVLAQNASPLGGVGNLQFFDNTGAILTSGVVYIYQAGTTTQATVYVDSTGTTTQPNPVTFGSGARASIWLANGTFVKVVLCVQNDGAFCSAGDILFSADQVPIGTSSSGGGGSPFTGIFISSTASPATSGTLRLASGDSVCWRNAAGSANLCFKKDSNDLLSWDGGSLKLPEVAAPAGVAGFDILWADNTAHRLKGVNNAGTAAQYVLSGNDIGTTDQVLGVHFGATQQTFGNTAPTSGQEIQFNGSNLVGYQVEMTLTEGTTLNTNTQCTAGISGCPVFILPNAHTITRVVANTGTAAVGCSTNVQMGIRDVTASSNVAAVTITSTGVADSGVLSVATTAAHQFTVGPVVAGIGCSTFPVSIVTVTYQ